MKEQVYVLKGIIQNPVEAFKTISRNGKTFLIGAVIIVVLPTIIKALFTAGTHFPQNLVKDVAGWLILVACLYGIGKLLKGKANFIGLLSAIGYAKFPLIFMFPVGRAIPGVIPKGVAQQIEKISPPLPPEEALQLLKVMFTPAVIALVSVIFALLIWTFALYILASRESHEFNTWRAFWSIIIGGVVFMTITAKLWGLIGL